MHGLSGTFDGDVDTFPIFRFELIDDAFRPRQMRASLRQRSFDRRLPAREEEEEEYGKEEDDDEDD